MSVSVVLDMFLDEEMGVSEGMASDISYSPIHQPSSPLPTFSTFSNLLSATSDLVDGDFTSGVETQAALDSFMQEMGLASLPADVSESSSDDDLISKLSSDLEMPLPLDGFEPVSSWSPDSKNILDNFPNSDITSVMKSEGDFSAEELSRVFYPNMECSDGNDTGLVNTRVEHKVKQEPQSPRGVLQMPPSPDDSHDIWELLCDTDIKPNLKALITPPVTPPQNEGSPPNSPQPPSPVSSSATIMLSQPSSRINQGVIKSSANQMSQPIKVLTVTTRNGATVQGSMKTGRITKTMKIQPKVVTNNTSQPQVISIVNSSNGQKITIPKSVMTTRSLPTTGARVVQLKPPPTPTRVTTSSAISNPIPSILTTQIGSASTVLTNPSPATTPLTPLAPALTPGMKQGNIPDLKALKRQQRMIKNRESASLSRKKKKEYVTALETNISALKNENQKLKEENIRLQQRITTLESECTSLRQAVGRNPSRKTTTALFALIFLLSLNLGPLTGILLSSGSRLTSLKTMMQGSEPSSITSGFKHRSLLWSEDNVATADDGVSSQFGSNGSYMCPMYINASESLRLETELRGLFENKLEASKLDKKKDRVLTSHPKTKVGRSVAAKYESNAGAKPESLSSNWRALAPPANIKLSPKLYRYVHPEILQVEPSTSNEENTSVMATMPRLSSFLEAIQRRDDTYYVVSFSPDHLLVPATARNDSARPRMSLLMPTLRAMNESLAPPEAHIAMMQIDCEVIHTRLVHVSEEVVPPHLRAGGSNASHPAPDTTTSHRQERRNARAKVRPFFPKSSEPSK
ncbi:cyclic AMP-dependent transcription factor ATF-6 alpha-like isoform X2 [Macrobrachium nipponense]|uniref:cyclic AMP-dependent transcription factor ATF-6 alpha-like isoform X2 n=1 Tax=Macrobrachium nipponense TaxID=159736 RepID=UPI0030C8D1E4